MGVLWSSRNKTAWSLGSRNLVGRGPECAIRLDDRQVSTHHGSLTWKDGAWRVRDLGSRNGTWVDDVQVVAGTSVPMTQGQQVRFGANARWTLVEAGPPGPAAIDAAGACTASQGGMLVLPNDEDPRLVVYEDGDGGWILETDGEPAACVGDQRVQVDDAAWRLLLPASSPTSPVDSTWARSASKSIETLGLDFTVSQDEEHVDTVALIGGARHTLRPRVHHFLLLQLARVRLADGAEGLSDAERGWAYTEDLCKQLQMRPAALNLHMLRARQELAALGVEGVGRLFERRRLSGQVRLTVRDVAARSA
jgi:hypothetical protein